MSLVRGKDVILYVFNNGTFLPIACARTCVFTTTTDIAGKSTIGSGIWKEFKPIVNGGTLSADGIVSFDSNLAVSSLRAYQFNLSELQFQFKVVDESGDGVLYEGTLIITSIAETGNYNDIGTYSMQAVVTGNVTITSTIGNPGIIFYNTQDNNADPIDFSQFIEGDPAQDITIHYGHLDTALYYWMAHSISAAQKTDWEDENEPGNAGTIGGDTDLFEVRLITINGSDYILYITRYVTFFNGYNAVVKFFRIPSGCLPPTDFAITNIVNNTPDDGNIIEVLNQNILTAGISTPRNLLSSGGGTTNENYQFDSFSSTDFTASLSNTRFTYTGVAPVSATFTWSIQGTNRSLVTPFILQLYQNGVAVTGTRQPINQTGGTFSIPYSWSRTFTLTINPGDYIEFNARTVLSDSNYLLTSNSGSLSVDTNSSTNQEFQVTGSPQVGGVFNISIYGTLVSYTVPVAMSVNDIVTALVNAVNNAAIAVPLANQPPSVVSAVQTASDKLFINSGSGINVSANYLPASTADVTFDWTEPDPVGITYTIRVTNTDLATTDYNIGGVPTRDIILRRGYNYNFAIRTNCDNGSSDWTADLTQFIP